MRGIVVLLSLLASAISLKRHRFGGVNIHLPSPEVSPPVPDSFIEEKSTVEAENALEMQSEATVEAAAYSCTTVINSWRRHWGAGATCPSGYTMTGVGARQTRRHYDYWSQPRAIQPNGNGAYAQLSWWWGSESRVRCCKIPRHLCYTKATGWRWHAAHANCKGSHQVTGGGLSIHGWPWWWTRHWQMWMHDSRPSGNGWYARTSGNWVRSFARCCSKRAVQCVSKHSGQGNWVQVNCPSGKIAMGGGWEIRYPWHNRYQAFEDSWNKGESAWVVDSGYGYGWSVAHVRCCKPIADKNLCKPNQGHGDCDKLTKCSYNTGSYTATTCGPCPVGYTGTGKKGCKDINECAKNNGDCDPLTKCENTVGSMKCGKCPSGYTGDGYKGCDDIDECEENEGACDKLTQCNNKPGGYDCSKCPTGYEQKDGKTPCVDIDECKSDNGKCDKKTKCSNTIGSRVCTDCPAGYHGNGADPGGCSDINECAFNNGGCDPLTTCTNTPGSFKCGICPKGYEPKNGISKCKDINECLSNKKGMANGSCHKKRKCVNTRGSFRCEKCAHGWVDNGDTQCKDLDECRVNNGGCDPLSKCLNEKGTRKCGKCPSGYEGSGTVGCTDYDECKEENGRCDKLTKCINTPGSRLCGPCPIGYVGDGYSKCQDKRHVDAWTQTTKLDMAKAAAKTVADLTIEKVNEQNKEQAKDQEKLEAIRNREKDIASLDENLVNVKWKVLADAEARTKIDTNIKNRLVATTKAAAEEKVRSILDDAFTGKVADDDSKEAPDEATAENNPSNKKSAEPTASDKEKPKGAVEEGTGSPSSDKATSSGSGSGSGSGTAASSGSGSGSGTAAASSGSGSGTAAAGGGSGDSGGATKAA